MIISVQIFDNYHLIPYHRICELTITQDFLKFQNSFIEVHVIAQNTNHKSVSHMLGSMLLRALIESNILPIPKVSKEALNTNAMFVMSEKNMFITMNNNELCKYKVTI